MISKIIYWIDDNFFEGRFKKYRHSLADSRFFKDLEQGLDGKIVINYQKSKNNDLAALCDMYGSDKGSNQNFGHPYSWAPHSYVDLYTLMFQDRRYRMKNIFECGIGTSSNVFPANMGPLGRPGASLRVWRDYFPNAQIYGADIDKNILFDDERIKTFYVDQTNHHSIVSMFKNVGDVSFDLIVDDGLHTFEAGIMFFELAWSSVAEDGVYIIEDIGRNDLIKYKRYYETTSYDVSFVTLKRSGERFGDNSLIFIKNNSNSNSNSNYGLL